MPDRAATVMVASTATALMGKGSPPASARTGRSRYRATTPMVRLWRPGTGSASTATAQVVIPMLMLEVAARRSSRKDRIDKHRVVRDVTGTFEEHDEA